MLRRLYFLFPDEKHAQRAVDQLINRKIPLRRIHAISRGVKLTTQIRPLMARAGQWIHLVFN